MPTLAEAAVGLLSFRFRSLQRRIFVSMLLIANTLAAGAGVLVYQTVYQRSMQASREGIESLGLAVARTAAIGAYGADQVLMQEIAEGLARNPNVGRVDIIAQSGAAAHAGPARRTSRAAVLVEPVVIPLLSPFDSQETVGSLRIEPQGDALRGQARERAALLVAVMIGQAVVLALLLNAMVRHVVTRPLRKLAMQLAAIRPGTPERLAMMAAHPDDEIGIVLGSANQLLADVDGAMAAERALHAQVLAMQEQYRRTYNASSAGIFVLDGMGRLIDCNPTVKRLFDDAAYGVRLHKGEDFIGQCFVDHASAQHLIRRARESGKACTADLQLIGLPGQHARWVHCLFSVSSAGEASVGPTDVLIEGVLYDVTERRQAEDAARHRADHDSLTGLLNRGALQARIRQLEIAHYAVLYLDLDGFKRINDTQGHHVGDEVLRECAQRLQQAVRRQTDLIARIGGDEFLVAMPGMTPESSVLADTAAHIVDVLSQPVVVHGVDVGPLGVSLGIACCDAHGSGWRDVVDAADHAMYAVKRHGRGGAAMALLAQGPAALQRTESTSLSSPASVAQGAA